MIVPTSIIILANCTIWRLKNVDKSDGWLQIFKNPSVQIGTYDVLFCVRSSDAESLVGILWHRRRWKFWKERNCTGARAENFAVRLHSCYTYFVDITILHVYLFVYEYQWITCFRLVCQSASSDAASFYIFFFR